MGSTEPEEPDDSGQGTSTPTPPSGGTKPSTSGTKPSTSGTKPSTSGTQPSTSGIQPPSGTPQPPSGLSTSNPWKIIVNPVNPTIPWYELSTTPPNIYKSCNVTDKLRSCTQEKKVVRNANGVITYQDDDCGKCGFPGDWVCVNVTTPGQFRIDNNVIPVGKWCLPTSFNEQSIKREVKINSNYYQLANGEQFPNCSWKLEDVPTSCVCPKKYYTPSDTNVINGITQINWTPISIGEDTYAQKRVNIIDRGILDGETVKYWNGYNNVETTGCGRLPTLFGTDGLTVKNPSDPNEVINLSPEIKTYNDLKCSTNQCSDCEFEIRDLNGKKLEPSIIRTYKKEPNNPLGRPDYYVVDTEILKINSGCDAIQYAITNNRPITNPVDVDIVITKPAAPGGRCLVQAGRQQLQNDINSCPPQDCRWSDWYTVDPCTSCNNDMKTEYRDFKIAMWGGQCNTPNPEQYRQVRYSSCRRDPICNQDCVYGWRPKDKPCSKCDGNSEYVPTIEEEKYIVKQATGSGTPCSETEIVNSSRTTVCPVCQPINCEYGWKPKDKPCSDCTGSEYIPTIEEVKYIVKQGAYGGTPCNETEIINSLPRTTTCPVCQPVDCSISEGQQAIFCSNCSDPIKQSHSLRINIKRFPGLYGGNNNCPYPASSEKISCDYSNCPVDCVIGNWTDKTPGQCPCNTTNTLNSADTKIQIGTEIGPFNGGRPCTVDMPRERTVPCDYSSCTNIQKIIFGDYQQNVREITSQIPLNTSRFTVQLWGGGGSTPPVPWAGTYSGGGGGGYSSITMNFNPDYRYFVFVGKGGEMSAPSVSQVLRGGRPITGRTTSGVSNQGGAGGDGSLFAIYDGSRYIVLAIAGGGGGGVSNTNGLPGAGGQDANPGGKAGKNGAGGTLEQATSGQNCSLIVTKFDDVGGFGGSTALSNFMSGYIISSGGGGYGGGSSGAYMGIVNNVDLQTRDECGGGGGNYAATNSNYNFILNSETQNGDRSTPGKSDDPNRGGAGEGGYSGIGKNGKVVLTCVLQSQNCTIGNWTDQNPNACDCNAETRPTTKIQVGTEIGPFMGGDPCTGNEPKTRTVDCNYSSCGCKVSTWGECKTTDTVNQCGPGTQARIIIYPDLSGTQPCPSLTQNCSKECSTYYVIPEYNTIIIQLDPFEWGVDLDTLNTIAYIQANPNETITQAILQVYTTGLPSNTPKPGFSSIIANKPIRTIIDEINSSIKADPYYNDTDGVSWNFSTKQINNINRDLSKLGKPGTVGLDEIKTKAPPHTIIIEPPVKLLDSLQTFIIRVPPGNYTPQQLVDALQTQFQTLSIQMNISYNSNTKQFIFSRPDIVSTVSYKRNNQWEYPRYSRTFKFINQSGTNTSTLQNIIGTLIFNSSQQSITSGVSIYAGTNTLPISYIPQPATGTQPSTAPATSTRPATSTQLTPATGTQLTPATGTQLTPATGTQLTPATGTQSAPATGTQSAPATGTQSAPPTNPNLVVTINGRQFTRTDFTNNIFRNSLNLGDYGFSLPLTIRVERGYILDIYSASSGSIVQTFDATNNIADGSLTSGYLPYRTMSVRGLV